MHNFKISPYGLKKVFKSLIPDGPMKVWSFRVRGLYFIQADGATDRKAVRKEKMNV